MSCKVCGNVAQSACGNCKTALYCDEICAKTDWQNNHSQMCKFIGKPSKQKSGGIPEPERRLIVGIGPTIDYGSENFSECNVYVKEHYPRCPNRGELPEVITTRVIEKNELLKYWGQRVGGKKSRKVHPYLVRCECREAVEVYEGPD